MTEYRDPSGSIVEEAEEILRRRAEALARAAEEDSAYQRTALLVFRIGQFWYAVRTEEIREIAQDLAVTEIPCVPPFVLGVVSIRGEIVSVTDAATLMGVGRDGRPADPSAAIVLENAECVTALVVDEVGGIIDVPASGVEPPLPHLASSQAEFVAATVFLGDRLVSLLNVDRILQPVGPA